MCKITISRKCIVLSVIIILVAGLVGCSSKSPVTPQEAAYKIFGEAKDDSDGIVEVAFSEAKMNMVYQYYPLGKDLKKEIGVNMASKIKKLYKTVPEVDEAVFIVQLPYEDKYGNTTWKKSIRFSFTRNLYEKINWKDFLNSRLLDVVENITIK